MTQKDIRKATVLALITAAISGFTIFLNKIAITAVKDPIVFTTLKNAVVMIFIIGLIISFRRWQEIKTLSKKQWTKLILIGVVGGSIPFALYFTGLAHTSAVSAGLIHKTLIFWILLLAIPFLGEKMSRWQLLGIAAIFSANLLVGGFTGFKFNLGELMILSATILWAIENIIAKVALRDISSLTVAGARMTFGSILLFGLVAAQGNLGLAAGLNLQQWGWTLISGILLTGYVVAWYAALKLAPATYVATLLLPATLVTNVLSAIFVTHALNGKLVLSTILFLIGITLLIRYTNKTQVAIKKESLILDS